MSILYVVDAFKIYNLGKNWRFGFDNLLAQIDAHLAVSKEKSLQLAGAIKTQVETGDAALPNDEVKALVREQRTLQAQFLCLLRKLQREAGISEAEIRAIERAEESRNLPGGGQLWHAEIFETRSTEELDELAAVALHELLGVVDPQWLDSESAKTYRLDNRFLSQPLYLVNGVRLFQPDANQPQRFAKMLLATRDHLERRNDLDFYAAASYVPEIAALGNSLNEIAALGDEAQRKLHRLSQATDDEVSSTIFELLVGAACVRKGINAVMLPETKATKVPDFRIEGLAGGIPAVIECKRRLGLSEYELAEAQFVKSLFDAFHNEAIKRGIHGSLEVTFAIEAKDVDPVVFLKVALEVSQSYDLPIEFSWGTICFRSLRYFSTIVPTRLYSADYLESAFRWQQQQKEWDGIFCAVEPPTEIIVGSFRSPLCLKWRCINDNAILKKSLGVSSLWNKAIKQVPPGEIGFVYIAYPEGAREEIADARTKHVLETMADAWHTWYIRVPVTVISRLYPRALHEGRPDLIENSLPGAAEGQEHWLTKMPWMIFTRQFEKDKPNE
jgi:hypothetical protein